MGTTMNAAPRWVRTIGPAGAAYRPADQPGLPADWWRANNRYTLYMARELSSVFLALWAVRLLRQLDQARRGRAAYEAAVAARRRPLARALDVVTLLFAMLHSATFLLAAGKGPVLRMRGRQVSERAIAMSAYVGWAGASLAVLLALLLGGREGRRAAEGGSA